MNVFQDIAFPKVIYEVDSPFNGHIQVIEAGRTRRLIVDKITQSLNIESPLTQKQVWGRVLDVLKANVPDLNNILILGLGGATMQHIISEAYSHVHIVTVEIDPVMIDVAKKYFKLDEISNHQVIQDDACRFIVEPDRWGFNTETFGAVIVDIYVGQKYPELGKSGNFISAVRNLVIPGGLVIFNRIYTEAHQDDVNAFIESVSTFLNDVQQLVIAGNTNSDNVLIYGRA